ncbi:MAG: polysaccharide biosynthesis protein [Prevotella sp.]|nr:polysaccharide biosynthesis protein [Prevotella sp.]
MSFFNKIINWYFRRNSLPYWCILGADLMILLLSGILSYWIFNYRADVLEDFVPLMLTLLFYVILSVIGIRIFHTYSGIVRFSSFVDLQRVAYANLLSLFLAWGVHYLFYEWCPDWMLRLNTRHLVVMFLIATLQMWGYRVLVKTLFDISTSDSRALKVLIYGAMSGGVGLAKNIRSQRPKKFQLRGFISRDPRAKHMLLMGVKVWNENEDDLENVIDRESIEAVLVSPLKGNDFRNDQALQDLLISKGVKIFMAQNVKEMPMDGSLDDTEPFNVQMKEVSVEDLLPRDEIQVDMGSLAEMLEGTKVLITGSAGSIGAELVKQVARFNPEAMMLIDQAETPQHDIRLMMEKNFPDMKATTVVTSVSDESRMEAVFKEFRPDYVFHAAAYKHVPMMEDNPSEAVVNNIYGTKVVADLADKYGVKKFVMISTDKAVNPTNVMGCSKRICEIYVQSLGRRSKTQFVTTRFGNVLGSNGSVIPLFREQIKNGGPVTVTHPDIIRYFMLIPEACKLVLEAGTKGHGGEIFVFDMGQPVKIATLAQRMINLSGAKNVQIKYTSLRDGEKLYEEVLNDKENTLPTFHKKIRIAKVREYDFDEVCREIDELFEISKHYDNMATVKKMKEIVPEYKSKNSVYEALDIEESK